MPNKGREAEDTIKAEVSAALAESEGWSQETTAEAVYAAITHSSVL